MGGNKPWRLGTGGIIVWGFVFVVDNPSVKVGDNTMGVREHKGLGREELGKVGKIFRVEVGGDRQVGIGGNSGCVLGNTVGGSEAVEMTGNTKGVPELTGAVSD